MNSSANTESDIMTETETTTAKVNSKKITTKSIRSTPKSNSKTSKKTKATTKTIITNSKPKPSSKPKSNKKLIGTGVGRSKSSIAIRSSTRSNSTRSNSVDRLTPPTDTTPVNATTPTNAGAVPTRIGAAPTRIGVQLDFDAKANEIRQAIKDNYIQQKKLMNDLRELMNLHKKEIKVVAKARKGNAGRLSGFNKPEKVPESLKNLLDIEEPTMSRMEVTKKLYQYFKDNKMYHTNTKKEIIPNKEIKEIFGMKKSDTITFYNLQTWLKKVYHEDQKNDMQLNIDD